jgi:hypothetical protein
MLDLAQGVREQIIKETAPKVAAPKFFNMRALRRAAVWGSGAAGALLIAVLASRGDVGTQRLAAALSVSHAQTASQKPDIPSETQRFAEAVRSLTADNEQMKSRLAAVEQDMSDVTGAVSKQIEAAAAARRVEDGPTVAATASISATMTTFAASPTPMLSDPPSTMLARTDATIPAATSQIAYGIDIGSGLSIQDLRTRWTALRSAHPQLFAGLEPIVSVKEVPRGNRLELRLVAGPLAQAGDAAQLCASLTPFGLFCQPTMFDGQRLALR